MDNYLKMNNIIQCCVCLIACLSLVCEAGAQIERGDLLIINGTVLTVTNGTLDQTDILIQNGKITEIGVDLESPEGIAVVDAQK